MFEKLIIPILPIDIQNKIGEEFIALEKNYINLREQLIKELYVKKKEYQSAINESIKLIPDNK